MKLLVTGASGQVGSELQTLASMYKGVEFYFTDTNSLDITDNALVEKTFADFDPDFCINCAAYTAVDKAENDKEKATLINATAVGYLAKACKKHDTTLLHISSDYVYHNQRNRPLVETDATMPQGVYAQTKLAGDELALKENPKTVVLRTSWVYAAFGHNFVKTMLRLGKERDRLAIVYDQIGVPTYARDIAQTLLDIALKIQHGQQNFSGIYHYAPAGVTCWYDFAKTIFELENIDCEVAAIPTSAYPTPAKRPNYSVLNCTKIKQTFGIEIPYWKDSLKECLTILSNDLIQRS